MIFDGHAVADARVGDARAGAYLAIVAYTRAAFDVYIRVDDTIAPDLRLCADVGVRGVNEGHAAIEHQAAERALAQDALELCQLDARVDAGNFARVAVQKDTHVFAIGAQDAGHVRQVIFALRVGGLNASQSGKERAGFKAVDARVDFLNLPFLRRRVLLLHNLLETPFIIAHDAPVSGRVFEANGQHGAACSAPAMRAVLLDESAQSFCANERHIAGENQNGRTRISESLARSHHSIARPALFDLFDKARAVLVQLFADGSFDLFGLMTNDDMNGTRGERSGGSTDMRDERTPAELVQDFRRARAHTCAESSGEDQHV